MIEHATQDLEATTPDCLVRAPDRACRAIVVVPARNEERTLLATLDALRLQVDLRGEPLEAASYEVLLLLNNCSDASARMAREYAARYANFRLLVLERAFPPAQAHVGTARRLLLDLACARLEQVDGLALLSTDADSVVAPDWLTQNLLALARGADVVGGMIHLLPQDYAALEAPVRAAYQRDRTYQTLVARLEALLDPDEADPWPRHLEHFGASLACTPAAYRRCGGLPPVKPLEDVAFVQALRKVGARIRHAPDVHVATSARLNGRAEVGLSGQLRHWRKDWAEARPHEVPAAAALAHRFRTLAQLRKVHAGGTCDGFVEALQGRLQQCAAMPQTWAEFLECIDVEHLLAETLQGPAYTTIAVALKQLPGAIAEAEAASIRPALPR